MEYLFFVSARRKGENFTSFPVLSTEHLKRQQFLLSNKKLDRTPSENENCQVADLSDA